MRGVAAIVLHIIYNNNNVYFAANITGAALHPPLAD
jgi:hypothetical protein